ncbi:MAG: hypothetical protein ACK559_05430, partial [bacterium]
RVLARLVGGGQRILQRLPGRFQRRAPGLQVHGLRPQRPGRGLELACALQHERRGATKFLSRGRGPLADARRVLREPKHRRRLARDVRGSVLRKPLHGERALLHVGKQRTDGIHCLRNPPLKLLHPALLLVAHGLLHGLHG